MTGRVMNVSGIPFLGFGYKDNQRQDERKKKDFGNPAK
jgi:hypothetical protein